MRHREPRAGGLACGETQGAQTQGEGGRGGSARRSRRSLLRPAVAGGGGVLGTLLDFVSRLGTPATFLLLEQIKSSD